MMSLSYWVDFANDLREFLKLRYPFISNRARIEPGSATCMVIEKDNLQGNYFDNMQGAEAYVLFSMMKKRRIIFRTWEEDGEGGIKAVFC